jgi:hypothetical protein
MSGRGVHATQGIVHEEPTADEWSKYIGGWDDRANGWGVLLAIITVVAVIFTTVYFVLLSDQVDRPAGM